MSHYSRSTYIRHISDLHPGDLVDMSSTLNPLWCTVDHVGICDDDPDVDDNCNDPDDCVAVIFFPRQPSDETVTAWHVSGTDEVYARLLAVSTAADVETENDAHDAAALARSAA